MALVPEQPEHRRKRDPESTRISILEAAQSILARDGLEGLSVSSVAKRAGVNRGTAYQHFQLKEELVRATLDRVSHQLMDAVFDRRGANGDSLLRTGEGNLQGLSDIRQDIVAFNTRLAEYASEHPDICRIWLYDVLSRENPKDDVFYKSFEEAIRQSASSGAIEQDIDTEVHAVLMLAGFFLWPVWARSHARGTKVRREMAERFATEVTRLSMHGVFAGGSRKFRKDADSKPLPVS